MLFRDANKLLEPGYLSLETGYCRLIDGQIVVAALTRMPECTGEMVEWWFQYLDNSQKYKRWCPEDHIDLKIDLHRQAEGMLKSSWFTTRRIGGIVKENHVKRHHPSDFLDVYDPAEYPRISLVCANVYSMDKVLESRIVHCVRDMDFGCETRSRIWLMNADDDLAINVMRHCLDEMGNLAAFLPELFQRRNDHLKFSDVYKPSSRP